MSRLDPEALADLLDAALICSPRSDVIALAEFDRLHRHKATRELAHRLLEQMQRPTRVDTCPEWRAPKFFD